MENYQIFKYNDQDIEFDITGDNLMINATEMGKIFGKTPKDFFRTDETKSFIEECLKKANMPNLKIETVDDLYITRQRSGTWMHRILALKFAAWLNPAFDLWIICIIDQILFGDYRHMKSQLKQRAARKNRIDHLKNTLAMNDEYMELERLELEERQAAYRMGKENKQQLDLFRSIGIEV